ncbi:MAG TPA: signal peptidase I [Mogibacterium sp.]|nr:signal peptidase I [Mogibacterium sp.]
MIDNFAGKSKRYSKGNKTPKRKNKDPVTLATLRLAIKSVLVAIFVTLIFTFVFGVFRLNDMGMIPNAAPGDMILFYRIDKKAVVGDVVVFSYKGEKRTARVVALPGDTVDIDEFGLKINGNIQYEPKIYKETLAFEKGAVFPIKLKDDEYFILGDNRDKAIDSRLFGPVTKKDLYGKVFTLIRRRNI